MGRPERTTRDARVAFGMFWLLLGLGSLLDWVDLPTTSASEGVRVVLAVGFLVAGIWLWRRLGYTPKLHQSPALTACVFLAAVLGVANLFLD